MNKGVPIVYSTAIILSVEKVVAGCMYINMQGPNKKMAIIIWEMQVERAFLLPSALVSQRMQDDSIGEHQHDKTHCTDGPTVETKHRLVT